MGAIILDTWRRQKLILEESLEKKENVSLLGFGQVLLKNVLSVVCSWSTYAKCLSIFSAPRKTIATLWRKFREGSAEIPINEVKQRLIWWRQKRQNQRYKFLDAHLITSALEGGVRNQ